MLLPLPHTSELFWNPPTDGFKENASARPAWQIKCPGCYTFKFMIAQHRPPQFVVCFVLFRSVFSGYMDGLNENVMETLHSGNF